MKRDRGKPKTGRVGYLDSTPAEKALRQLRATTATLRQVRRDVLLTQPNPRELELLLKAWDDLDEEHSQLGNAIESRDSMSQVETAH